MDISKEIIGTLTNNLTNDDLCIIIQFAEYA